MLHHPAANPQPLHLTAHATLNTSKPDKAWILHEAVDAFFPPPRAAGTALTLIFLTLDADLP